jgi:rod shape-determining protein MreB
MLFNFLFGLFSADTGIDLGTATTLVQVKGEGNILCEPSVVAIQKDTREVLAVGEEAKRMIGRTPANIVAIRPLKDGVIADFEITETMISYFIKKIHNRRTLVRPRIVIAIPSGITDVERRAVKESAERAGAREVYLIEEPMAAAIGANIKVDEAAGNMIVDIGGGTTEVAVISLGGMVISNSIRIAGDEMDEAIIQYAKKTYNLYIGDRTAEEIKIRLGSAYKLQKEETMEIKGRDALSGLPKTIKITSEEIREALKDPVSSILSVIVSTLEQTPPELSSDIVDRGIVMAGGGALLKGLDRLVSQTTGLPVVTAENAMSCVVIGATMCLDQMKFIRGR